MTRIPISIQKFKTEQFDTTEVVKYLFIIEDGSKKWDLTYQCTREALLKFKDEIEKVLSETSTAEILRVSEEQAKTIDQHHETDSLCKSCQFKMTHNCVTCLFELQSPLERKLFVELLKSYIRFNSQYALNWQGEHISLRGRSYDNPTNNFKDVLTVADFYVEARNIRLYIYTDGHTYHERTEVQAQRDRNIDRKLQELGFQVLRYTGKEVNEDVHNIIRDIKSWIEKGNR